MGKHNSSAGAAVREGSAPARALEKIHDPGLTGAVAGNAAGPSLAQVMDR